MLRFSELDPHLLNPIASPVVFNATLDAHGTYTSEHFVLRMSPRVHELVDALTKILSMRPRLGELSGPVRNCRVIC